MKKNFIKISRNLFLVIFMIIMAVGCVQNGNNGNSGNVIALYANDEILGRWKALDHGNVHPGGGGAFFQFNSNGTGEYGNDSMSLPMTFTKPQSNSIMILTDDDWADMFYFELGEEYIYTITPDISDSILEIDNNGLHMQLQKQ